MLTIQCGGHDLLLMCRVPFRIRDQSVQRHDSVVDIAPMLVQDSCVCWHMEYFEFSFLIISSLNSTVQQR